MDRESYLKQGYQIRGEIIYKTVLLERIIDSIIARHFFNDVKSDKFHEIKKLLISDRMEFSKKVQVFKELLISECGDSSSFNKKYPKFSEDLKNIGDNRNDFAHNLSLSTRNIVDGEKFKIILYRFRKDEPIFYTQNDIDDILKLIDKYINLFSDASDSDI